MNAALQTIEMNKRTALQGPVLWYSATDNEELLTRAIHAGYSGVVFKAETTEKFLPLLGERMTKAVEISSSSDLGNSAFQAKKTNGLVLVSSDVSLLELAKEEGYKTGFRAFVDDGKSLNDAIAIGRNHSYLIMAFKDPTNIPLELVIASLQQTNTILIKEIAKDDVDDAVVTLGVMEVGADGVLFTPQNNEQLDKFLAKRSNASAETLDLSVGTVTRTMPVGLGYRSCIDLATLFSPTEGMIVGSTSQGGILCCPEVFHLPYMELRPFRVNAGAVHSYVYNMGNKTDYMTELKAGSPTMIVDSSGIVRRAYVGRIKTEVRPLRLIEVTFGEGRNVNVLMQDDWHVRIYSDDVKPLNITELKVGTKVLGLATDPGRHVGIKVSENILEN